jgi:nucleotide-binding universal stress UspA family protein
MFHQIYKHILIPTDGSELVENAVAAGMGWPKDLAPG